MAEDTGPNAIRGLITDTGLKERQNPSYICSHCGNMLWKFKNDGSKLTRVCRNCNAVDDMESNLVYVNEVKFDGGVGSVASADMVKDPTLPRAVDVDCNSCHFNEAVFFQKPMRGDEGMKLIFMCIQCARGPSPRASVRARHAHCCAHAIAQVRVSLGAVSEFVDAVVGPRGCDPRHSPIRRVSLMLAPGAGQPRASTLWLAPFCMCGTPPPIVRLRSGRRSSAVRIKHTCCTPFPR